MRMRTLDNNTYASHPGRIRLSHEKLHRFHPELYPDSGLAVFVSAILTNRTFYLTHIEEHLMYGDSRAALVVRRDPILVAAYTDELDCVAMLRFPKEVENDYPLEVGTRLLTVNTYSRIEDVPVVPDLQPGEQWFRRYGNFSPFIAEFLSDDLARIEARKAEIEAEEWERAGRMAAEYLKRHGERARDGRPLRCSTPARVG